MKMIKENIIALLFLALPATAISSPALVSSDHITIETRSTNKVRIMETSAVQSSGDLVIRGKVKRVSSNLHRWVPLGHINAELLDSQGVVLYETSVEYFPRIIPKKSISRQASFSLRMPIVAPDGSFLRLSFHPNSHS